MKRYLLIGLALAALGLVAFLSWDEIVRAFRILADVRWQFLFLIPLTQSLSFYGRAKYYQTFLANLNYKVELFRMYKLAYAVNFVNQISPSVGVTGATYLSFNLRDKVPSGKVTLIEYSRYIATHLAFIPILVLGLGFIYFGGVIDKIVVRIVVLVVVSGLVASLFFLFAFTRRKQINKIAYFLQRVIDRAVGFFRPKKEPLLGEQRITQLLGELHEGYDLIISNWRNLRGPLASAALVNVMEIATLYISFLALSQFVNPGSLIVSYAVANIAGAVSIVPGDVGVYEFAMVAAFSGTGTPIAIALSATLLYRILSKAFILPVGFYFYSRSINNIPPKRFTQPIDGLDK